MSITPTAKKTWRSRLALFSAIGFGITGVPLALAAPAQAETSYRGCTVDPLDPQSRGNGKVDFKIKVHCRDGRTVQIKQVRYEDERRNDHYLGSSWFRESFDRHDKAVTLHSSDWVRNDDRPRPGKGVPLGLLPGQHRPWPLVRLDTVGKERPGNSAPLIHRHACAGECASGARGFFPWLSLVGGGRSGQASSSHMPASARL